MLLSNYKISLKTVWQRVLLIGFLVLQVLGFCDFHASCFAGWVRSVLLFLGVGRVSNNLLPGQSWAWGKTGYDSRQKLAALCWRCNLSCPLCLPTLAEIFWASESLKGAWTIQPPRAAPSHPSAAHLCLAKQVWKKQVSNRTSQWGSLEVACG